MAAGMVTTVPRGAATKLSQSPRPPLNHSPHVPAFGKDSRLSTGFGGCPTQRASRADRRRTKRPNEEGVSFITQMSQLRLLQTTSACTLGIPSSVVYKRLLVWLHSQTDRRTISGARLTKTNGHAYADAPTQEGSSLRGKVKNPDDPLTKNLACHRARALCEGAPPPQKPAPEKKVQDKRKGGTHDRDHGDGDYDFEEDDET